MVKQNEYAGPTTYKPGLGHVGSYQVAGQPYITGSNNLDNGGEHTITFPMVAKRVIVVNHSSVTIRVHFAAQATDRTIAGYHFIELDSDEDSIDLTVKCNTIYVSNASGADNAEYRVIAELTNIDTGRMYDLNVDDLAGISE